MTEPTGFEQAAVVVTLKGGPGYEAPWVVLRGNTADEAQALLEESVNGDLLETTGKAAVVLQGAYTGALPQAAPAQAAGDRPPLSSAAPAASGPTPDEVVLTKANFQNKDAVKALGGRWNATLKAWTVKPRYEPDWQTKFAAYL